MVIELRNPQSQKVGRMLDDGDHRLSTSRFSMEMNILHGAGGAQKAYAASVWAMLN